MDDAYINRILTESGSERYPEAFLKDYEAIECLSRNEAGETLLVKNKSDGGHFVAKCYLDKTLLSHVTEADILKSLAHPGLPRFFGAYENEHMLCVVREYVEGVPLDRFAAENPLNEKQAALITQALCDILSYLHQQTPPVIHRDIKPQNLIVDANGRLHLIDFGISRLYDESSSADTVCYGTRFFAAPEQYGFAQTDIRTDIFSLGVLLGWLLTGESELKSIFSKIKNHRLLRIVKKCTSFTPDMRFHSAQKVKQALRRADGDRQKRALSWIYASSACAICLCLGFIIGRYTNVISMQPPGVAFKEPLIEQAVRLSLGKDADERIENKELLSVMGVYIYGDHVAADDRAFEELNTHFANNDGTIKNGGIVSLEDLAMLTNLKVIRISFEDISDLSPLSELMGLEMLDLRQNPVTDLSPLSALPALKNLVVFETRVSDFSALSGCLMLEHIDAGKTYVTSPDAFRGLNGLKTLGLEHAPVQTLSGIESFSRLEQISLSDVADGDLSPLLMLPYLTEVHLDERQRGAAEEQLAEAAFSILY